MMILTIVILSVYFGRKCELYIRHMNLRYKSDIVKEFIPHGEMKKIKTKHILFWNNDNYDENFQIDKRDLESVNCPVTNCVFSRDQELLSSVADYNAIIFDIGNSKKFFDLPKNRKKEQIYIMASQRTPSSKKHNQRFENQFFNMTFTYRRDSDVQWAFGRFYDVELETIVMASRHIKWRKPEIVKEREILEMIKRSKTKLAVGSSNKEKSIHIELINKIQQFMRLDMIKDVTNHPCQQDKSTNIINNHQKCTDMLNSTYKFYFAFENSICADYMTEKVFLNMENYIVPVLFNGITDMQHFLPPHSYIHFNDSTSVEDLVNYLKYLDRNPQEYANYFWWKKYYKVIPDPDAYSYCDLCLGINEWNVREIRQTYFDVNEWFSHNNCYTII